ncbi:lytic transglycosylase domain-containing protein [Thioclava sp. FR2]|uniref:lytic transglycosylase domain-containing protein n=1 Tax=Thioclava sp. FR2 TaxID=3445780 RepID=UPI003EB7F572
MRFTSRLLIAGIILVPFAAGAEGLSGERDFTFKRVKVGAGGAKRIIVQIDPVEQARLLALAPKVKPRAPTEDSEPAAEPTSAPGPSNPPPVKTAAYEWFWQTVPTSRGAVADRFPLALATLSKGPGGATVSAPRLQKMQEMASNFGKDILAATIGTDVSPALALAVIAVESAGNAKAESKAGAQGLMQLIPATAERFGVANALEPAQNIKGGVAYLHWLLGEFDRDPLMVLAAYNAGEGAVRANDGVPPYAETRDYVPKVLAAWQVAQGLCLTPPELVTDPCVFKVISSGG